jgi:uncharacterized phiE125 gp8 family phage protein
MTTKLVTPPAALAVSLEDAKLSLREDGSDKDALIIAWIKGITAYVEHYTGRALIHRQMRVTLDAFPTTCAGGSGAIAFDHPPTASVDSIRFLDLGGTLQTLDPQDYLADLVSEPGYAVVATSKAWPATLDRINAVTADYTAGYSADSSGIPEGVKLFILAKLVEQFDVAARLEKDTVQSSFLDRLLDPYRMYG